MIHKGTLVEKWTKPSALPKDAVLVDNYAWSSGKPFGRYSLYHSAKTGQHYHVKMPKKWIALEPEELATSYLRTDAARRVKNARRQLHEAATSLQAALYQEKVDPDPAHKAVIAALKALEAYPTK